MTLPGESAGLKDGESEGVIGLLCMPAILGSFDADEEDAVGHLVGGTAIGVVQAGESGVSCGTFLLGGSSC